MNFNQIMNNNQIKRYEKIFHENIYLIDMNKRENDDLIFEISGSTAQIYKIKFNKMNGDFKCNCLDASTHSRSMNCVCKHVCFILFKVFKFQIDEVHSFFLNLQLNDILIQKMYDTFDEIKLSHSLSATHISNNTINNITNDLFENKKILTEDDLCTICYDSFDNSDKTHKQCPMCHNVFHEKCIIKWISLGKDTCVLCRNDVWRRFKITQTRSKKTLFKD